MKVIMFQSQFADKVKSGDKPNTIRPPRKHPIRVGDMLSLRKWSGSPYRSPQVILREAECTGTIGIRISYSDTGRPIHLDGLLLSETDATALAIADGFESTASMMAWFEKTHSLPFTGVLIRWRP